MIELKSNWASRCAAAIVLLATTTLASAHPHSFIVVDVDIVTDSAGKVIALKQHWVTDEGYSTDALEGIDKNGDGQYDPAELAVLAKENVDNLKEANYFTEVVVGDAVQAFGIPTEALVTRDDKKILHLTMTIPLVTPVDVKVKPLAFRVFDPEYFVEFRFAEKDAIRLPASLAAKCQSALKAGDGDIEKAGSWGGSYASTITVSCQS
jgi:ABC-type uncharacterized transport system substrate-binding protein